MLRSSPASLLPARLATLVLTLVTAASAYAAPAPGTSAVAVTEAEAFATRAKELFKAKDFPRSAKLFMQAYALSHEPALVYNAARAYEEAGMAGDAASLFRLYISLTDDADGILEARGRIKRLEGKAPAAAAPTPPPPSAGSTTPVMAEVPQGHSSPPPAWQKWSATGGAAVALTAGVALLLTAKADMKRANDRLASDPAAYSGAFDKAETQWWTGAGLTGLGVGLAGVATWLWLRDEPGTVAVVPTVSGVKVAYSF